MGTVSDALKDVVPQLAPDGVKLTVKYPSFEVKDGVKVSPSEASQAPTVEISGATGDKTYTLVMVDPDAPSPENPVMGQWLHWLVVNGLSDNITKGNVVTPYMGPAPPQGVHRYIFLVFEEPAPVQPKPVEHRHNFNVMQWASDNGLGPAAAVTWFTASRHSDMM